MLMIDVLLAAALTASAAVADPQIQLDMKAYKTVVEIVEGNEVTREVQAETIEPGQELTYRISYFNEGDESATQVVVNNPITAETLYVVDSATGPEGLIEFSADDGESFHLPGEVVYQARLFGGGVEERQATPERYTHIRWVIGEIAPGESGELTFKLRVR